VLSLWVLVAVVVIGLIAVVPRKRSWGPITYRRRSFVGGPLTGRLLGTLLFAALVVLLVLAIEH
jgi:uncharacterized membrane protein